MIKCNFFKSILLILLITIIGCQKPKNPIKDKWADCNNPVSKDVSFRIGMWRQISKNVPNPDKIRFIDEKYVKFYDRDNDSSDAFIYRFDTCNYFLHEKYWMPPNPPFQTDYEIYTTEYNFQAKEWWLIRDNFLPGQPGQKDTIIFVKE